MPLFRFAGVSALSLLLAALLNGLMAAESPVLRHIDVGDLIDEWFGHMTTYVKIKEKNRLSSWDFDETAGSFSPRPSFVIHDTSTEKAATLHRRFIPQRNGRLRWEFCYIAERKNQELRFQLAAQETSQDGPGIVQRDGKVWWDGGDGVLATLGDSTGDRRLLRVDFDLEQRHADVWLDHQPVITVGRLPPMANPLQHMSITTGVAQVGALTLGPVFLQRGYAVRERFLRAADVMLPPKWSGHGHVTMADSGTGIFAQDTCSLRITGSSARAAEATVHFSPASTATVLRFEFMLPEKNAASFVVQEGGRPLLKIEAEAEGPLSVVAGDRRTIIRQTWRERVWYQMQIDIDAVHGSASLSLFDLLVVKDVVVPVGRTPTALSFHCAKGVLWVDDVEVFAQVAPPADYVPTPRPVATGDIILGIQSCDLWRDGVHLGWGWWSARQPERKPILGWYNGGDPEVEDWSIKYMQEAGIAFDLKCWYRARHNLGNPVRSPKYTEGLTGFRRGRYGHQFKYAICLTNHMPFLKDLADWKDNMVPYLIENLFSDPRYLRIDGKPLLAVYSWDHLVKDVADPRLLFDHLREECRKAGLPGVTLISQERDKRENLLLWEHCGFAGNYSYTWGAANVAKQKRKNLQWHGAPGVDQLCTLSMGWDLRGWGGEQGLWLDDADFRTLLTWAKEVYLPKMPPDSLARRLVILDNWNEYGEGHFMMPCPAFGFRYLNAIREVFGQGPFPANTVPTESQRARLDTMFPKGDW